MIHELKDELVPRSPGSGHPIRSADVGGALIIEQQQCSDVELEYRGQCSLS